MEAPKRKYQKHKVGFKISVRHYLRKDFNLVDKLFQGNSQQEQDSLKFPLYIRVAFLQQSVKLKSRLDLKLSEEEFEFLLAKPEMQYFIDLETAAVQKSVEEFKPDTIENFTISQWTAYYNVGDDPILTCLTSPIMDQFLNQLQMDNNIESIDKSVQIFISNLQMLKFLAAIKVPQAVKTLEDVTPFLSLFTDHGALLDNNNVPYFFSYWDWKFGLLQAYLKKFHSNDSEKIIATIDKYLPDYELVDVTPRLVDIISSKNIVL